MKDVIDNIKMAAGLFLVGSFYLILIGVPVGLFATFVYLMFRALWKLGS